MNRLLLIGTLVLINGLAISGVAVSNESRDIEAQPDGEQGQDLYRIHCLDCHGAEGRGDGPRAALLAPRPGNLVSAAISTKTDEELLEILAKGVPRTAMHGWSDQLSEEQRRNVLAYVRTLVHFQDLPSPPSPGP